MNILKKIQSESALGLVEAVVSIGIIGTAMIVITNVAMGTIKRARKVELEDVAIQAAVEAMDYLKIPSELEVDAGEQPCNLNDINGYAYLDRSANQALPKIVFESGTTEEISSPNIDPKYKNSILEGEGYEVYQQVQVESVGSRRYEIVSKVVWRTIGGEYGEQKLVGYRYGKFENVGQGDAGASGSCPSNI